MKKGRKERERWRGGKRKESKEEKKGGRERGRKEGKVCELRKVCNTLMILSK